MRIFDMIDINNLQADVAIRSASAGFYSYNVNGANYERIFVGWTSNTATLQAQKGGSGTLRTLRFDGNGIEFRANGTTRWTLLNTSGHLVPNANNTYDFGDPSLQPRNVYAGTAFILADGVTAPIATVGLAKLFVDTADGDLKIIFGDGTVKTITVDT